VLGAVVLLANLPEIGQKRLKLTGDVAADIFLGRIKQWNDPRIAALNAGAALPSTAILVVHRSDGSGTSAVFTDYLAKVSADWKSKVGAGTSVKWPTGLGGKGNEGVAGLIKQTPGAFGYVELIYAASNGLPFALLKNKAGEFVDASPKSVTAAADAFAKEIPQDFRISITDAGGKDSYPISSFTYLLIGQTLPDATKGKALIGFLTWALTEGQGSAESLQYAPLPKGLSKMVLARIKTIQVK
jgi:phosphate transport system substrate-binding protein